MKLFSRVIRKVRRCSLTRKGWSSYSISHMLPEQKRTGAVRCRKRSENGLMIAAFIHGMSNSSALQDETT